MPLRPNAQIPTKDHPDFERAMETFRAKPCVLYVGQTEDALRTRLRGYRFKPYLQIVRRPKGTPPRHEADSHKGRALLHAHQYFNGPIFLWWAEDDTPRKTEDTLIKELNPVLNTSGVELLEPE